MNNQTFPASIRGFVVEFSPEEQAEIIRYNQQILESGRLHLGPFTERFEQQFAALLGMKYAVAVNSGSSALEIIFRSIDAGSGSVLVPSNTNFATAISAVNAGASLRLYDSGLLPDFRDLQERIALCPDLRAVVVVHIGGYITPDMQCLVDYCAGRNILLVEDAAQAHGSEIDHRFAGTFGTAAAFSFVQTKVVTTGEGGMLVTNDEKIAGLACRYRNQGYAPGAVIHELHGNSWRMTEYAAVLGLVQLERMLARRDHMQAIVKRYAAHFAGSTQMSIVDGPENSIASGYKCIALAGSQQAKQRLVASIRANGVEPTRCVYEMPLHRQPLFTHAIQAGQQFPVADDFAARHFCLPLWRTMPFDLADEVCRRIATAIEPSPAAHQ